MDFFEYILIITSVVYAMAVAQIMSGISRIAQSPGETRAYLAHTIWVLNLFVFIFLVWWAGWEFRAVEWTFPQYGYVLVAPTLLYFACSLLVPQNIGENLLDLETHFFRIRRPLCWSFFLASAFAAADGNVLSDEPLWHEGRYGHLLILCATLFGAFSTNKKAHNVVAIAVLIAIVIIVVTRMWSPR